MKHILSRKLGLLSGIVVPLAMSLSPASSAESILFSAQFDSGLNGFSANGRVTTASYGARLRGGATSLIQSPSIAIGQCSQLQLTYQRNPYRLDQGESLTAGYVTADGEFTALESTRNASGVVEFPLPNTLADNSIQLRFELHASSYIERADVNNITLTGQCGDDSPAPPIDNDVEGPGPFTATIVTNTGPTADGWLAYPNADEKLPIFIWGPGGGTGPADYEFYLNRIASHGFAIYAEPSTGDGNEMIAALDWLTEQNNDPASPYYNTLDLNSIAYGGHSLGSISTYAAAQDPRITTTIHVAGGSFDGNGPDNLQRPALYVGGTEDFATANLERDYNNTEAPVFFTVLDGSDHIYATRDGQPVIVAWLRWHLMGETARSEDFLTDNCYFCLNQYDSAFKNW